MREGGAMADEKALRKSQDPRREAAGAARHAPARDRRRGLRGIRHAWLCRDQARGRGRARAGQQGPALSLLQDQGRAVQGGHPQRHHRAFRRDARADGEDRALVSRPSSRVRSSSFIQELVGSKRAFIARLLIAEGHKHPELTAFYYEQVVSRGIETMTRLIDRGIERGEFKPDAFARLSAASVRAGRSPPSSGARCSSAIITSIPTGCSAPISSS